jgi:hypothetical protein
MKGPLNREGVPVLDGKCMAGVMHNFNELKPLINK